MVYIYYQEIPKTHVLNGIMELHKHVFEGAELKLEELTDKKNLLIFVAVDSNRIVGFKIGYEYNEQTFYSWLGGVHSDYRGKRIASELMRQQHEKVKSLGFSKVRTISRNKRRAMLLLNIKFGFDIVETFMSEKGTHKIVLEKELS
ncbi:GNAT family N-acetyltransferase [Psychrobacillus sp. NEAU-3TGS]|uniref:GNAT family N-acetyltransferase n=1 Tax=Psychrobacillus sp. NEAU-3TGS TaxID=2995412 RepID=UPI002498DA69|nr:GNAT family N-acetyltransferase [Psychrobacillus sp. NEAU-3TGS]MDI2585889.1 GNAT family N-acetyltransferase [Psychrobacillus sp. NEAU-3TGS]